MNSMIRHSAHFSLSVLLRVVRGLCLQKFKQTHRRFALNKLFIKTKKMGMQLREYDNV